MEQTEIFKILSANLKPYLKSYNIKIILRMLEIIGKPPVYRQMIWIFQNDELKKLFPSKKGSKIDYNRRKYSKYINLLLKLKLIAYNESYIDNYFDCKVETFRLNFFDHSNDYYYKIQIPNLMRKNSNKTFHVKLSLKCLNQKISLKISEKRDFFTIETTLKLPFYSPNALASMRKRIFYYIVQELKDKEKKNDFFLGLITKNVDRFVKNRASILTFHKDYGVFLTLISEEKRDLFRNVLLENFSLKTEIHFHDIYIKFYLKEEYIKQLSEHVKNLHGNKNEYYFTYFNLVLKKKYLLVKLKREINRNVDCNGRVRDVYNRFIKYGINNLDTIGIDTKIFSGNISRQSIQQLHIARKIDLERTKSFGNVPELSKRNDNKRNLAVVGFNNFEDFIDHSGGRYEYEINFFNRDDKSIENILSDLDFLIDFDRDERERFNKIFPRYEVLKSNMLKLEEIKNNDNNKNKIIEINNFEIAPPIEKGIIVESSFLLEGFNELEIYDLNKFGSFEPKMCVKS